jgi:release factor glutamine methyltransferase
MNTFFRNILRPLPWLLKKYLASERTYNYKGLFILVKPGVFHPGLFHSTMMLLEYVEANSMTGSFLEVGGGTGIISILAAKKGAEVVVSDISLKAIENMKLNAATHSVSMKVIHSNLFENIEANTFDWIVVNPPYYPSQPIKDEDYAWYCGAGHDYFVRFFEGVRPFVTDHTRMIMVLSEVCDLPAITSIASNAGFKMEKVAEKSVWVDGKNYLFQIKRTE